MTPIRQVLGLQPDRAPAGMRAATILIFVVILSAVALVMDSAALSVNWRGQQEARSDIRAWTLSQMETDYSDLQIAVKNELDRLEPGQSADLSAIRLAFDIFYSRVDAFGAPLVAGEHSPQFEAAFDRLVTLRNDLARDIDAISEADRGTLIALDRVLDDNRAGIRDASVAGLTQLVSVAQDRRETESRVLLVFVSASIGLAVLMVFAAVLSLGVGRQLRRNIRAAQQSTQTLEKVLDAASAAIVVTDDTGRVLRTNAAAVAMLGPELMEFVNPELRRDALPDLDIRRYLTDPFSNWIGMGHYRSEVRSEDGTQTPVMISTVALDDDARPGSLAFFLRDMTAEARAEQEMRRARDAAEAHAAAKTRFLVNVSHEMRTPLHGLIGAIDLLEDEYGNEESTEVLAIAKTSACGLLERVEDMLDIMRADDDDIGQSDAMFCPTRIALRIRSEMQDRASAGCNRLDLDITGETTPWLYRGSASAFSRVLEKLVANGLDATRKGTVTISLRFTGAGDRATRLDVEVRDDGAGISAEDQQRVFDPFEKTSPYEPGAGLGLTVAHALARMMGGTLRMESAPGTGSRLSFAIDLEPVTEADPDPGPKAPARRVMWGGDALVVDDNMVNVMLMRQMAERAGFRVDEAMTGQEALRRARSKAFDLVVLDYMMPGMNGLEVAHRIRQGSVSRDAVILCVTAVPELIEEADLARNATDAILSKPLDADGLTDALRAIDRDEAPGPIAKVLQPLADVVDDFDFDELRTMLGQTTAEALLVEAMKDAHRAMTALQDTDGALDMRIEAVHQAVASASMTGFRKLGHCLKQAQNHLMDSSMSDMAELADQLCSHIRAAEAIITSIADEAVESTGRGSDDT